jgi:penicillin-binding protein 2
MQISVLNPTESRPLWRIYCLLGIVLVGIAVLGGAVAYRQLAEGEHWTAQMAKSSTRVVMRSAPRGNILDRNRVILVDNRPSYSVALFLEEFRTGRNAEKLVKVVHTNVQMLKDKMKIAVNVNDNVVRNHYRRRPFLPLTVWNDLSPAAMASFAERSPWGQGIDFQVEPVRVYPFGSLASHILGYVGKPEKSNEDDEEFDAFGRRAFSQPNVIGKAGIEAMMDESLRGKPGFREIRLDAAGLKIDDASKKSDILRGQDKAGLIKDEIRNIPPIPGNSIILSIDQEIQAIVEEAFTGYRGACIILDPRNGDVLAMASVPNFDPNLFVPAIKRSDWKMLNEDPKKPLMNRSIQGSYSPGSTFKVVSALAGLESGIITTQSHIECPGRFFLGNIEFKCWELGGHGDMSLFDSITMSCNVFFYTLGSKIPPSQLWNMAEAFGLGQKTGVPLKPEESGILPTDEWKRKYRPRDGRWSTGDSVNMSIGQGQLNVTPLQMAVVAATMANGGTVYKPRLILREESPQGDLVKEFPVEERGKIPATPEHIQFVRKAMLNVVENGTGKHAGNPKVKIAAKTGSAQFSGVDPDTGEFGKQTRAWMISFMPYEEPRYSMAIIAEGGQSGGSTAGPIVGAIYKKLLALEEARKNPGRPVATPAVPVTDKVEGFEGDVSGELMGTETEATPPADGNMNGEPVEEEPEPEPEPPPLSFPASKAH